MKIGKQNLDNPQSPQLNMNSAMAYSLLFAEWIDWNKYERFEGRRDLWYDKKSSYSNPLPIKTTEDLWNEFVKHCS